MSRVVLVTLLLQTSILASRFQILNAPTFITDGGVVVPAFKESSHRYHPKFFPPEYKLGFETKQAYEKFVKESVVVKELKGGTCYEYVVFRGELIGEKRFLRSEYCDHDGQEAMSCEVINMYNEMNDLYEISYRNESSFLMTNCLSNLIYKGARINRSTEKVECKEIKVDLKKSAYPNTQDNRSNAGHWYITDKGMLVVIDHRPYRDAYYISIDKVFFETKGAFEKFKAGVTSNYKRKSDVPEHRTCSRTLNYKGIVKRDLFLNSVCLNEKRF